MYGLDNSNWCAELCTLYGRRVSHKTHTHAHATTQKRERERENEQEEKEEYIFAYIDDSKEAIYTKSFAFAYHQSLEDLAKS